jgi:flagellar biosynthesis protein FliP
LKTLKLSIAFFLSIFLGNAYAFSFNLDGVGTKPGDVANVVEIVVILTVITLAPSILIMMTSFTRILIVFGFLRRALGLQTMPPDQILVGLSLFLTMFLMWPTFEEIYETAFIPYSKNEGTLDEFGKRAIKPLRKFMFNQTRKSDLKTF